MTFVFQKAGWDYTIANETGTPIYLFRPFNHLYKAGWILIEGQRQIVIRMVLNLAKMLYSWHADLEQCTLTIKRKWLFSQTYLITWGSREYTLYQHKGQLSSIFYDGIQVGYTAVENNTITFVCNNNEPKELMLLIAGVTNCYMSSSNDINLGRLILKDAIPFNHEWKPKELFK